MTKMNPLGAPRAGHDWRASTRHVDMATTPAKPRPLKIAAAPQNVTIDLKRTAIIVVDMQNDFCAEGGWVDHLGADYTPDRLPIAPLQKLLPVAAKGQRSRDLVELGQPARPRQHAAQPDPSLQDGRHRHRAGRSAAGQWRAGAAEGLVGRRRGRRTRAGAGGHKGRQVPHQRLLGHAARFASCATSTSAPSLFSGVNTDQCVLHSLTDANFLGYGCVLVEDCCGTTSPDFCREATIWNVKKCFGFVTDSKKILRALKK